MIRLTKRRLAQLNNAISLDDILHEKFRCHQIALQQEANRLFRHRKRVQVLQRKGKVMEYLRVEDVQFGPDFTRIIVR
jgi:hypothetical protein